MKNFISWIEEQPTRLRRLLAIFTAIVWLIATSISYALKIYGHDTLAIYSLVTAQFATVIAFYFVTKASTD